MTSHRSRTWNILTHRINCTGKGFTCASVLGILTVLGNPHGWQQVNCWERPILEKRQQEPYRISGNPVER